MNDWGRQYYDAWNGHDAEKVAAFMADDAVYENLAVGVVNDGRTAIANYIDEAGRFSRDYRFEVVSEQNSGDRYAFEWIMLGTHTGESRGLPATNKPYRIRGVSVGRLTSDGKIQENRDYWNLADFLGQVGLLASPTSG